MLVASIDNLSAFKDHKQCWIMHVYPNPSLDFLSFSGFKNFSRHS